jgi:hypothetical protein
LEELKHNTEQTIFDTDPETLKKVTRNTPVRVNAFLREGGGNFQNLLYSKRKRFWPLKYLNWNLGASHLPEVCWKGLMVREGTGKKEENVIVSFFPLSQNDSPKS